MINRLYVHNFRCLENFDLAIGSFRSALLVGRNGAGKTTVGRALEVFQAVARGKNRVGELIKPKDMTLGRTGAPVRFEIEVELVGRNYAYTLAFDFPEGFRELRVREERLAVDGEVLFSREFAQVRLARTGQASAAAFGIDWHLVALPIVQEASADDPLFIFKQGLANMLILRPVPACATGDSDENTLHPDLLVTNVGAWFSGLIAAAPSAYATIDDYLRQVMPDFKEIRNPVSGKETRSLSLHFNKGQQYTELSFKDLSDGERCFIVFALTIAANAAYGPLICFWDEPDNFLAPEEVGPSVMALRSAFRERGQLLVTTNNTETIRHFSDENTLILYRNSHFEPTIKRWVEDARASGEFKGSFVDAVLRGEIGQ